MSEVLYTPAACPENCAAAALPAVVFNDCTDAVASELSEITDIFVCEEDDANPGEPKYKPTDWTDAEDWDTAIVQSGAGIRHLTVIGDKPLPETTARTISKGRIIPGKAKHKINFDIDDVTDANYALLRRAQCGGRWVIWYATADYLYGGPKGFSVQVENAGEILARGENNYTVFSFILSWKAKDSPPRIVSPWAA